MPDPWLLGPSPRDVTLQGVRFATGRWRIRKIDGDWTITPPGGLHPIDAAYPSQTRALDHALHLARLARAHLLIRDAVEHAHQMTQDDLQLKA